MLDEVTEGAVVSDARTTHPAVLASQQRRERSEALTAVLAAIDEFDDDDDEDHATPAEEDLWTPGSALDQFADTANVPATPREPRRSRRKADRDARPEPAAGQSHWWYSGDQRDIERLADSLPFDVPAGYRRDGRGVWRYEATGDRVPGARDRTLATCWKPTRRGHCVALARNRVRGSGELQWMIDVEVLQDNPTMIAVPATVWNALSSRVLGLTAPELSADRLWDVERVAGYLGVNPGTVWAYHSRDKFPEPVTRLSGNPVWSEPLVTQWDSSRPGQGARSDISPHRRKQKSARK